MKKRIFSLVLLVSLLMVAMLSFTSCGESREVNKAIRATGSLTDIDADVYIKTSYYGDATKTSQHILINENGAKVTSAIYGEEGTDSYFDKDYAYITTENGVSSVAIDQYVKENGEYDKNLKPFLTELSYFILNAGSYDSIGGKLVMEAQPTNDQIEKAYGAFLKTFWADMELDGEEPVEVEYEDCKLKIIVKDGYLAEFMLDVKINIGQGRDKSAKTVSVYVVINNAGSQVSFTLPSDIQQ